MGHLTWSRPFQGRFVICWLGLAMFNPHTKFKMSTMTCNVEVKGNAKCKNSRFEPPLGVTHRVHLWLAGKRVVDFLLAIIAILANAHGCGTITFLLPDREKYNTTENSRKQPIPQVTLYHMPRFKYSIALPDLSGTLGNGDYYLFPPPEKNTRARQRKG